jgi:hypothetical protein
MSGPGRGGGPEYSEPAAAGDANAISVTSAAHAVIAKACLLTSSNLDEAGGSGRTAPH